MIINTATSQILKEIIIPTISDGTMNNSGMYPGLPARKMTGLMKEEKIKELDLDGKETGLSIRITRMAGKL